MSTSPRIAFVHTGAVVIPQVAEQVSKLIPEATVVNYLDDKIVADLGDPALAGSVPERVSGLVRAAHAGGADIVMLTCSSISYLADPASREVGVPVLRIDEALADTAVAAGQRIAVLATLPTTLRPTTALIEERAALAGRSPELVTEVIDGAFSAVAAGDRPEHDRLVAAAIERVASGVDVVVLAQASMASAAETAQTSVPVLTSVGLGIERLRDIVAVI